MCRLLDLRTENVGFFERGVTFDVADFHYAASIDFFEVFPAEVSEQGMIIVFHRLEIVINISFGSHKHDAVLHRHCIVCCLFLNGEKTVNRHFELGGDSSVVKRCGKHEDVRLLEVRVDFEHVVFLDAWAVRVFSSAKASETGMYIHLLNVEGGDFMSCLFSTFGKFLYKA